MTVPSLQSSNAQALHGVKFVNYLHVDSWDWLNLAIVAVPSLETWNPLSKSCLDRPTCLCTKLLQEPQPRTSHFVVHARVCEWSSSHDTRLHTAQTCIAWTSRRMSTMVPVKPGANKHDDRNPRLNERFSFSISLTCYSVFRKLVTLQHCDRIK